MLQPVTTFTVVWYDLNDNRDSNSLKNLSEAKVASVIDAVLSDGNFTNIEIRKN